MPSAYRVAAPSIRIVPWAARASFWPLPQQLLPVSATGGGRRCCALGIFSGKLFFISRLSRSAERSKRYFHGWGRNGKRPLQTLASSPSQALPRQLSQRESQAVKRITKVLGAKRKLPVVLLALPLGELAPQVTEWAHAVSPVTKVSDATRNFPAMPKAPSQRELAKPSGFD